MFKIFKTEGFKERRRYEVLCKNFKSTVKQMNELMIRRELIEEYVRHLEE
jgi:hypothetical protein